MKLGVCFEGLEPFIEAEIRDLVRPDERFIYVEIGIFQGDTLSNMAKLLRELKGEQWKAFTTDIANIPPEVVLDKNIRFFSEGSPIFWTRISPILVGMVDFCLIDACHGYQCATVDFLAAEKYIRPGGSICFHDTSPKVQGLSFQEHCQSGIDVRKAIEDLGLLENKRRGWKLKRDEQTGYGCVIVERI